MAGITLAAGVSFVVPELLVSYFIGPELTVIVGSVVSLACVVLLGRLRRGKAVPAQYDMRRPPRPLPLEQSRSNAKRRP